MVGAAEDVDGSCVVLAGRTRGNWAAVNAGGSDFAAAKICLSDLDGSTSGEEIWRYQVRWKLTVPSVDLKRCPDCLRVPSGFLHRGRYDASRTFIMLFLWEKRSFLCISRLSTCTGAPPACP